MLLQAVFEVGLFTKKFHIVNWKSINSCHKYQPQDQDSASVSGEGCVGVVSRCSCD